MYCDMPAFGGESGAFIKFSKYVIEKQKNQDVFAGESLDLPARSVEYGSYIIEAMEKDIPFKFNGNIKNENMITNLPHDCCAEGPIIVDKKGLHPSSVGELPIQCVALNITNINVQRLAAKAAIDSDTQALVHACMMDPLTSAALNMDEIRAMAIEMLEAQRRWLPQFDGKAIEPMPIIDIPEGIKGVDVPLDPALAIAARFGKLGE